MFLSSRKSGAELESKKRVVPVLSSAGELLTSMSYSYHARSITRSITLLSHLGDRGPD